MGLYGVHQAGHHRFPQACLFQNLQTGIGGGPLQQRLTGALTRPAHSRMGAKQLCPAVTPAAVGVHNPAGQVHQFSHMAYQQYTLKSLCRCPIQSLSHKIRASNHRNPSASPSALAKKILPIVSRGQNHPPMPLGRSLAELNLKGIYHRLDTHGLHNSGGS